jgi:hypothetical protein
MGAGAALLIVGVAVILGGCVTLSNPVLNANTVASANHQISLTMTATADLGSGRGVIAIRVPEAWEVKSVNLTGSMVGVVTRSAAMEAHYASSWESQTGAGFNGPKPGYKWWVGYSPVSTWTNGNVSQANFLVDAHGRGGTYLLDFVTGFAAATDPDAVADNSWYIGSVGEAPGALLDQAITLYAFSDVTPGVAYYDAIQGLASEGVIEGYPMGGGVSQFRPTNSVFRAQFAKMIDGVLGLSVDENMTAPVNFTDLGADDAGNLYPHEYVWVAYSNNIIKGYTDGSFRPYIPISRGHVVTMTVRAALADSLIDPAPPGFVQTWGNDLLPEHKANAAIAEYNGLLAGLPLTGAAANGNASMPRGEVAQVLWNLMNLSTSP